MCKPNPRPSFHFRIGVYINSIIFAVSSSEIHCTASRPLAVHLQRLIKLQCDVITDNESRNYVEITGKLRVYKNHNEIVWNSSN